MHFQTYFQHFRIIIYPVNCNFSNLSMSLVPLGKLSFLNKMLTIVKLDLKIANWLLNDGIRIIRQS